MPAKVLMLLNAPYPADIRIKKETSSLIEAGHQLHLLCVRRKHEEATESVEGIRVHRIDAGKNNYQLAVWDVVMSLRFVHPKFRAAMRTIIIREQINLVHVHDLPLAGTALSLKKELNLKVLVDLHENYPEALRIWFSWKKNPIARLKNFLFMNPDRWTRWEKIACEQADTIIAVVDEMKSRLVNEHQLDGNKVAVVSNTEEKTFINQQLDHTVYQNLAGKFIIAYTGGIGPHRGVDVAIKGMSYVNDPQNIHLVIVGFGSKAVMRYLQGLVTELNLNNVHFLGYQPFSKFFSYMSLADVNVIPHQSNGHTDHTIPHKLFQGMMTGKPMLVSSSAPLKRVVETCKSGLVFKAGDEFDFALRVNELSANKELCSTLGANGKKATLEGNLNWEHEKEILINLYNSFT
ncbi:MAG: glycosyltransferase family 4 protein [Cyclobacteriaceae bacterium]|nr:glycosyltransferase family 4 protein [Cyclobacteriaceae bacterium]